MSTRHLCAFRGCREMIGGEAYVCGPHWRDLPVLLQRALTGSRGPEREAAKRQVQNWINNRHQLAPTAPAVKPFHETKDDS